MRLTGKRPVGEIRDSGLQAERTALAWTRTTLALVGVAALVARLLVIRFGLWAGLIELAGGVAAGIAMLRAGGRYQRWSTPGPRDGTAVPDTRASRAGAPNAALAAAVVVMGLAAIALASTSIATGTPR